MITAPCCRGPRWKLRNDAVADPPEHDLPHLASVSDLYHPSWRRTAIAGQGSRVSAGTWTGRLIDYGHRKTSAHRQGSADHGTAARLAA